MTYSEFATELRMRRGRLSKHDADIATIYTKGTKELIEFTLEKKLMGIANIAKIATQSPEYQRKFTTWMAGKGWKAHKNELDLWFSSNPWDRDEPR